jgi:hypothetical protein
MRSKKRSSDPVELARRVVARQLNICRRHGAHRKNGEPFLCVECTVEASVKSIDAALRRLSRLGITPKEK